MPLSMAPAGVRSFICKITGKDEVRHFLGSLGFVEGEHVTVISELGGNMIVSVKNTRIAISKAMAHRIMVEKTAS
jgi:ferrous iron transport protein A